MANNTVYPYGTDGQLPASIGIINDLTTGGADKALSAEMGKVLGSANIVSFFTNSGDADWQEGNISGGKIVTNYSNRYLLLPPLPFGIESIKVERDAPDSTYYLGLLGTSDGVNFTTLYSFGTADGSYSFSPGSYSQLLLLLWDKPTTARAQSEDITITFSMGTPVFDAEISKGYFNPVIREDVPDPTVWDGEDGYYYLFATGKLSTGVMYRSANLYEWERTGDAPYSAAEAANIASAFGAGSTNTDYWAPHVYKVNPTTWNLYISKPSGGVAILTSNHPTMGYIYRKFIAKPSGAGEFIDAEVAIDVDGKLWLYTGGGGSIYRREMTADGLDWAEGSAFERVAGLASNASGNVNREKTFEGPYLYRRGGYWYLFCSSGKYATGNYKLRVLRSQSLSGAFVDSEGNAGLDGYADTVLVSGSTLTGPGHNAPFFVDRKNNTWIIYHSHWSGFPNSQIRGACLDLVQWDVNGWPFINSGEPSISHECPIL